MLKVVFSESFCLRKQNKPLSTLCKTLIKQANDAGGHDNITAIIIHYQEAIEEPEEELEPLDPQILEKTGEYSFVFKEPPDIDKK